MRAGASSCRSCAPKRKTLAARVLRAVTALFRPARWTPLQEGHHAFVHLGGTEEARRTGSEFLGAAVELRQDGRVDQTLGLGKALRGALAQLAGELCHLLHRVV